MGASFVEAGEKSFNSVFVLMNLVMVTIYWPLEA